MKIVRYRFKENIAYGLIEGEEIREIRGDVFGEFTVEARIKGVKEVDLLAPCVPGKIVAVGLNYRDHAEEIGAKIPDEPLLFLKPSTAVIGPGEKIIYPRMSSRVDYEGELGVVIAKMTRAVSLESVKDHILGYVCFNDVTARNIQKKDKQWTRAKGFDTFAPLGPWIVTDLNPHHLKLETFLKGDLKQSSNTENLIFDCYQLVSFISQVMTLMPGDVIATGTPSGIGPMAVGDRVDVVIEGIGTLTNFVAEG
ncbi:MAG: fumarylacetoacetate hydrolase family protein [Syntrophobacterales bacterium]|nr:MAG: fumarylacetoacetate hydrolase family protein [Syntrophobacterales bacterium]